MADPQQIWSDYYARKRGERVSEAEALWNEMREAGVGDNTVLALDFICFGNSRADVEGLAAQLSQNYHVQVAPAKEAGYFTVAGTTRPDGVTLGREQHKAWVEFMSDVAHSYACVFSEWSLEAPELCKTFRSAEVG